MSLVKCEKDEFPIAAVKKGGHRRGATLASVESLAVPLVQEVVFLADFRCSRCQERVAQILAKMDGETQSVMISVVEKKVTLTCTYPMADKLSGRQFAWNKILPIVRLFRSSCT
ncbi:heavy metal transport/detoxification superfamily protein [Striga asiatica]|uniref:Heavy metal transport/detoxification superfamily protein n=1 Tax=Striga asiatica TaxID=4170 RepID=A0A5A7P6E6_STRAF|nr:heavy metal transport/detoxification superfamily protein [Striga asiatica]